MAEQLWLAAYGQGYLFLRTPRLAAAVVVVVVVAVEEKDEEMVEEESLEAPMDDGEGGSAEVALRRCSEGARPVEDEGA